MQNYRESHVKRTEFAHGQSQNMSPERMDFYGPQSFRGYGAASNQGRDYEQNVGYRESYDRLGGQASQPGQARGEHRGKGPRNYRRNDDRILEDINDRMCDNPNLDASDIEVNVQEGKVILNGTVDSKDAKWLAEDIGENVTGVSQIENRLKVRTKNV